MVLSGRPRTELDFSGGSLGAGRGLCWADCTVSMVSRYVRNMIRFENNEQPGTIPAPPRAQPHRRPQLPYPVPSSALSHTLEHPTASHSPPLGIPKWCRSLHPRSHTCQGCTPSRPRRLVLRFRLAASAHQICTQPPSRSANVIATHVESRAK